MVTDEDTVTVGLAELLPLAVLVALGAPVAVDD